jgi:tetratricopeptide (TPR) repeat protein
MEQNIQNGSSLPAQSGNILIKKLWLVLSVFVFLLPVFFVPAASVNLHVAKITLLATGLVVMFVIFLSSVLSTGIIEIPKVKYLLPMIVFAVVALVSSALSGSISSSIVGSVFDLGTSGSLLLLVACLFMVIVVVRNVGVVGKVISAFLYSAMALSLYTIFGSLAGSMLPTSLASKLPIFLAGGVVDTAIIFGAAIILSLCAINMTETSKKMKIILSILIAYGLLFIGAANFMPTVYMIGIVSLVFFVYILSWSVGGSREEYSQNTQTPESLLQEVSSRKISLSSLTVLLASVVLILGGTGIGNYLSNTMKVQTLEVRPNFQTTMNLTAASWQKNFALGIGPNRFSQFWSAHKPVEINQSQFWNADFYSGSGFVPTIAITTGLLGLLSLLAFIVMYLLSGVKAIFAQANASRSRYLATASFLVSLYLWIMLFLYSPSITVLALAFIFTGLFTATLTPQGITGLWRINIFSNPKTNFLSVLSIVILLIMSVAGGYFVWERAVAATTFQNGILDYQNTGNIQSAESAATKAISLVPSDVYWRGLTQIYLLDLNKVLGNVTNQNQMTDAVKTQIQGLIGNMVGSAKKATEIDSSNFQNWFALGGVYEALAQNGIAGSANSARDAYNQAAALSPENPSVPLALGRLDAIAGNIEAAKISITKAINLKNNYTDAYFALAQLQAASNDIPAAIKSVEAATIIDPTNSGLYFQLGLLKYNQKDFAGAAKALEQATSLVSDYANAKYFLGLSYYQLGRKDDAIKLFEDVNTTNPGNSEVIQILSAMKAGKPLFQNTAKTANTGNPPVPEKQQ